ncbi:thromboxane A2 receptor-like, partial [Lampetra planeri]
TVRPLRQYREPAHQTPPIFTFAALRHRNLAMALAAADNAAAAAGATAFSLPGVLFNASGAPTASAMENATASASPSCAAKSTPNRTSPWYSAIFTAAGLASNIFALVVVARAARRTRSRSRGAFLAVVTGLVATDLAGLAVTGAVVVSMHALDLEWTRVDPRRHLCRFFGGCMVFFGLSPLLLGCAMAVERRLGIARPLVHAAVVTRRGAGAAVLAAWALALAVAVAPAAGLGSYSVQWPGSWCFLATEGADGGVLQPAHAAGAVVFSLLGLVSLAASHLFNSTTVLTLVRARRCGGAGAGAAAGARRRHRANKHELEMVVQLLGIMVIATVCWTPLLVFIANIALKSSLIPAERHCSTLILGIRMATWNQILDPWVYILFRRSVMLRLCPGLGGGAGGGGTAASSVRSASAASVSMAVYGAALRTAASVKGAPEGAAVAVVTTPRGRAAVMAAVNGGGRGGGGGGGGGDTGGRRDGGDGRGDGGGGETEEESRL